VTDVRLASALQEAKALEVEAVEHWQSTSDASERDQALVVRRHATATRKALETWIGVRAIRATMTRR
jgi:hypothetical protein